MDPRQIIFINVSIKIIYVLSFCVHANGDNSGEKYLSIEEAIHPVRFTSQLSEKNVTLKFEYQSPIRTEPFWDVKFDGVSYIATQGHVVREGSTTSSSVTFPLGWQNQYLAFQISSETGDLHLRLKYQYLNRWVNNETIPGYNVRLHITDVPLYNALGAYYVARVERLSEYPPSVLDWKFVLGTYVEEPDTVSANLTIHRRRFTAVSKDEANVYLGDYAEMKNADLLFYYFDETTLSRNWDLMFIERMTLKKYSSHVMGNKTLTFVDDIYGPQDELRFDERFLFRSISCQAFGYPPPEISIRDSDGKELDLVNLKLGPGLTVRAIASLEGAPLETWVGQYTCTAWNSAGNISKTIRVTQVVRPKIITAEVLSNNSREIIVMCAAKGSPPLSLDVTVNKEMVEFYENLPHTEFETTGSSTTIWRYKHTGGWRVTSWYDRVEGCPEPRRSEQHTSSDGVVRKTFYLTPLPQLSRHRILKLFCHAEGYDRSYDSKEIKSTINQVFTRIGFLQFLANMRNYYSKYYAFINKNV